MELKNYQKNVISDLTRYLELLNETGNIGTAYRKLWEKKNVPVGFGGIPAYQNILPGVPDLCFKVPTGGGKTFLACNAIKPVFGALPQTKIRAVVWKAIQSRSFLPDRTSTSLLSQSNFR